MSEALNNLVSKARSEAKAEGMAEKTLEIAKNLISAGISDDKISAATGLSITEVADLRNRQMN